MAKQGWLAEYFSQPAMQIWQSEDFVTPKEGKAGSLDIWEPPPTPTKNSAIDTNISGASIFAEASEVSTVAPTGDFWDPLYLEPAPICDGANFTGEWFEALRLPNFQSGAAERPFSEIVSRDGQHERATKKARWLVSLLTLPKTDQRKRWATDFEEMFIAFPHQATFKVLAELALEDISAEDIFEAFELKMIWTSFPVFWHRRHRGRREPYVPVNGHQLLGWTRAVRFVNLSHGLPAEAIIDSDWYNEWLGISYGDPLYWSFLDYIDARLQSLSAGIPAPPITVRHSYGTPDDITIDGFRLFHDSSRTFNLSRSDSDGWTRTAQKNDKSDDLRSAQIEERA